MTTCEIPSTSTGSWFLEAAASLSQLSDDDFDIFLEDLQEKLPQVAERLHARLTVKYSRKLAKRKARLSKPFVSPIGVDMVSAACLGF